MTGPHQEVIVIALAILAVIEDEYGTELSGNEEGREVLLNVKRMRNACDIWDRYRTFR